MRSNTLNAAVMFCAFFLGNNSFAEPCNLAHLRRVLGISSSELRIQPGKALPGGFAVGESNSITTAGAALVGPNGSWVARTYEIHQSYNSFATQIEILNPTTGDIHTLSLPGQNRGVAQSPSGRSLFVATKKPPGGGGFGNSFTRFTTSYAYRIDIEKLTFKRIFERVNDYKPGSFSFDPTTSSEPMHMLSSSDSDLVMQVHPGFGKIGLLKIQKEKSSSTWNLDLRETGSNIMAISESGRFALIEDREIIAPKPKTKFELLWVDFSKGNKAKRLSLNVPGNMPSERIENFGPYMISDDGTIGVGGNGTEIVAWNLETGRVISRIEADNDPSKYNGGLTISPNGKGLLRVNDHTGKLQFWNLRTGKIIYQNSRIKMARLSPSGRFIAFVDSKTSRPSVGIYDVALDQTHWLRNEVQTERLERVTDLFFSSDETSLFASDIYGGNRSPTRTIRWDLEIK